MGQRLLVKQLNEEKVLVIEKRAHIGGNMYTHKENGINVHDYGAHIFHTDNKEVWSYVNQLTEFNGYINQVVANYKGALQPTIQYEHVLPNVGVKHQLKHKQNFRAAGGSWN